MSTVTAITPNLGAVGDSVTITGTGFGAAQGGSTVSVAGTSATVTSWSDTSITITIPSISTGGRVVVTVSGSVQADYKASWFELRDATCLSLYDAINGRLKAQDETNDSSPEDYRAADARDYNHLLHLLANMLEGPGKSSMTGLQVSYGSATTITIAAGSCMSSTGKHVLTLSALVTVSIATAGAALGLDETTLAATCTTGGNTTGTMSASIWSETPMTNTVRTLTGTISGAATTITGSGTKFLSECAVGDVLRSATGGARRITAIASDTSLTIVSAFTADPSGTAATLYENLTFWCDTAQSGDKRAVNTITHDGLTVTWTTNSTSNGAGKTAKVGVEIVSRWYFPWIVYGGSGATVILSTQRTRPYGVTGYTTAWRRAGSIYNDASGNILDCTITGGAVRIGAWQYAETNGRFLAGGAATTKTVLEAMVPPTAHFMWFNGIQVNAVGGGDYARVFPVDGTAVSGCIVATLTAKQAASGSVRVGAGLVAYYNGTAGASLYLDACAWMEVV